jgi:hypothetical protein
VKPFRGKPEKPERSKGEIHSRFSVDVRWSCDGKCVRVFSAPFAFRTDGERVHFSPGRTSRSVGCRSTAHGGVRTYGLPSHVRTRVSRLTRSTVYERFKAALGAFDSLQARRICWRSDLVPILTTGDCWRRSSRTDLRTDLRRYSFGYFQDPS